MAAPDHSEVFQEVMEKTEIDLYGEEAALYDLVYSEDEAEEYVKPLAVRGIEPGSDVLDLACGTGIAAEVLEQDYNVTGADLSRDMLEVAERKDLDADFLQADMRELPFEDEFDAVVAYGQPFSHLREPSEVEKAAESIYDALRDGGVLVTDFFAADAGENNFINPPEIVFDEENRISRETKLYGYDPSHQEFKGEITLWIDRGGFITNMEDEERVFRGYSPEEMQELLAEAGFSQSGQGEIRSSKLTTGFWAEK